MPSMSGIRTSEITTSAGSSCKLRESFAPVHGRTDAVPVAFKHQAQKLPVALLVINNQYV